MNLTLSQQTALYLVGEGYTSKRIALAMGVNEHAATDYVKRGIFNLGAKTRTQAAIMLREMELGR